MSSAFRDGPHPELFTAGKTEELYPLLNQRIHFLIDVLEYDPENIFILVANAAQSIVCVHDPGYGPAQYSEILIDLKRAFDESGEDKKG